MILDELSPDIKALTNRFSLDMRHKFDQAAKDRQLVEQRWLKDLRQYKGIYDPEVLAKMDKNQSKIFIRLTRKKVNTIKARLVDMLFPAGKDKNWEIKPTPEPDIDPVATRNIIDAMARQNGVEPSQEELDDLVEKLAEKAAEEMSEEIDDQLKEAKYADIAGKVVKSGTIYGTGILKGPMVEKKSIPTWVLTADGWKLDQKHVLRPYIEHVSIWDYFPDMSVTEVEDCTFHFQRHVMTKSQLLKYANRGFNREAIMTYLKGMPEGDAEYMTHEVELMNIGDYNGAFNASQRPQRKRRYELVEGWMLVDVQDLADMGLPEAEEVVGEVWVNAYMLGPVIVRASISPVDGVNHPFHLYYHDKDETSIWGDGVPSILRDTQMGINGSARAMMDNAAITAGPQIEVNIDLLEPSEMATVRDVYPRKVWLRNGKGQTSASPAVRAYTMPSHTQEYMRIKDMFEELSHELTTPAYMSGGDTTGASDTATGLSMQMGAASIDLKEHLRVFDERITKPFITAMYHWNMQFNDKDSIRGDFKVVARGSSTLVAKEIKARQLDQFALTLTPEDSQYVNRPELLRRRAEMHDLGDGIVKDDTEIRRDQEIAAMQMQAAQGSMAQPGMEAPGAVPGEMPPMGALQPEMGQQYVQPDDVAGMMGQGGEFGGYINP